MKTANDNSIKATAKEITSAADCVFDRLTAARNARKDETERARDELVITFRRLASMRLGRKNEEAASLQALALVRAGEWLEATA